jgi:hypothetical protein
MLFNDPMVRVSAAAPPDEPPDAEEHPVSATAVAAIMATDVARGPNFIVVSLKGILDSECNRLPKL